MDNQLLSSRAANTVNFPAPSKLQAPKTVSRLLDDKGAMDDWIRNIEKIRQKESGAITESAS